ncbi:MAG: SDR family NAD(P)-dependent oxidoreductase, partial [Pirellulaceae bacterium]|nr:SDR family NAD(P)-dependent oxidoreductase [Pirellulaceae bacterium]
MESGLENRVVLVTGASGGIGSSMVRAFLAEDSKVAVHYGNQRDSAEKLATESEGRAKAFQADLTQEAEVERLFGDIESELGPVECVIANAGIWPAENVPIHEMTLTQWNKTLAVDLTSVFLTMRRFFIGIRNFELKDPSAVLIGSTAAVFGEAGHVDYAAAKAGISYGMLQTLKNEISQLTRSGRVNAVCPGWVMTPMAEKFAEDRESKARALQTIPMQKFGQPEDIAASAVFLSSP